MKDEALICEKWQMHSLSECTSQKLYLIVRNESDITCCYHLE